MTRTPAAVHHGEAAELLGAALQRVAALVPYLRASIGPVERTAAGTAPSNGAALSEGAAEDGVWLSCRDLVDDPAWLGEVIRASGRAIGTDDPVVAASIFVQGYAYRLMALAVACLTAGGVVPGAEPGDMAVQLTRGRPSNVAYVAPAAFAIAGHGGPIDVALADRSAADHALRLVLEQVVERHLRPLMATVRSTTRIGERLLWGNVAASASTAFRTMEGCLGEWIVPLGERFFALAPSDLHGLGAFLTLESDGRRGWFWERTSCCLYDRLPGGIRCADCSRTPADERRAAYLRRGPS